MVLSRHIGEFTKRNALHVMRGLLAIGRCLRFDGSYFGRCRKEVCLLDFRNLTCTIIAAVGLTLSTSSSFAQQPDIGDQPGLLADDSVELDPEYRKQVVYYRTSEAPGAGGGAAAGRRRDRGQG